MTGRRRASRVSGITLGGERRPAEKVPPAFQSFGRRRRGVAETISAPTAREPNLAPRRRNHRRLATGREGRCRGSRSGARGAPAWPDPGQRTPRGATGGRLPRFLTPKPPNARPGVRRSQGTERWPQPARPKGTPTACGLRAARRVGHPGPPWAGGHTLPKPPEAAHPPATTSRTLDTPPGQAGRIRHED
jgi:hypothetical protein